MSTTYFNKYFGYRDVNTQIKRCSILLGRKEIKIKATIEILSHTH